MIDFKGKNGRTNCPANRSSLGENERILTQRALRVTTSRLHSHAFSAIRVINPVTVRLPEDAD